MNSVQYTLIYLGLTFLTLVSCTNKEKKLPILGHTEIHGTDTIYHKIPAFTFRNQDSLWVSNKTYHNKAYVADFFFISCPTICPTLTKQMERILQAFEDDDRLMLLSHTIDTKRDTIPRLKLYAEKLGVSSDRWSFVTGDQDSIMMIANDYFNVALRDDEAPGGFDHSGKLILVDQNGYVRSFAEGTIPEEVDRLIEDIELLLDTEYEDL